MMRLNKRKRTSLMFQIAFLMAVLLLGVPDVFAEGIAGTVSSYGKGAEGAVVYLEAVPGTFKPSEEQHLMDQKAMVFIPHVLPILKGEKVTFKNSDPIYHNIHTYRGRKTLFNIGVPAQGTVAAKTLDKVGEVLVLCDIHPEMEAWIIVRDNPYFALTGTDGTYQIENIPPGTYTIKNWHAKLKKPQSQTITVEEEGAITVNFDLSGQ